MSKDTFSGTGPYIALVKVHVSKDIHGLVEFLVFPAFFRLEIGDFCRSNVKKNRPFFAENSVSRI